MYIPAMVEHAEGVRFEGWATDEVHAATLRDAPLRGAPSGWGCV